MVKLTFLFLSLFLSKQGQLAGICLGKMVNSFISLNKNIFGLHLCLCFGKAILMSDNYRVVFPLTIRVGLNNIRVTFISTFQSGGQALTGGLNQNSLHCPRPCLKSDGWWNEDITAYLMKLSWLVNLYWIKIK